MTYPEMIVMEGWIREINAVKRRTRRWFEGRTLDADGRLVLPSGKPPPKPPTTAMSKEIATGMVKSRSYVGVTAAKGKGSVEGTFDARISLPNAIGNGSFLRHLGNFPTREEAARAYDAKAFAIGRQLSRLNFPNEYRDKPRITEETT